MERCVAELKQQPLLRVHRARLCRRDPKRAAVKALCASQKATVAQATHLGRAQQAHVHHVPKDPPDWWHTAYCVTARHLQL
jgi:hypothetical protein